MTTSKSVRAALAIAAMAALGAGLAGVGPASADAMPQTFPHMYSNVKGAPTYDKEGKPSAFNTIVWDHATVLTRSQTAMVRDSGLLPVVGGTMIKPYAPLAQIAETTLKDDPAAVRSGACLALFWSDKPFAGPEGKMIQVGAQRLAPTSCRP